VNDHEPRYRTPAAARNAVTDKLRTQAEDSPWQLGDLQRQYAYDQLIERLYRLDAGWVIEGATALLARRISVRHTIDIDVYRPGPIADVEQQVREAATLDIGDWMFFEAGPSVKVQAAGAQAARLKMQSFVGAKVWAAFQVDIVADGIIMTGEPESGSAPDRDRDRGPETHTMACLPARRSRRGQGVRDSRVSRWAALDPVQGSDRSGRDHAAKPYSCRSPVAGSGEGSRPPATLAAGVLRYP
jgi:hypothetical protein